MMTAALTLALTTSLQAPPPTEPTLVFVCEHGAARSVIAATYFQKIAAERGLRARAVYRGVSPQADLGEAAVNGLRADGLTPPSQKPAPLMPGDVDSATVIFAIGCKLPGMATASGKAQSWDDVPTDRGYGPMRDAIKAHVERLVDELLKKQRPPAGAPGTYNPGTSWLPDGTTPRC